MGKAQHVKACPDCGPQLQDVELFYRNGDEFSTYCKKHQKERVMQSRDPKAHTSYMREYMKDYRKGVRRRVKV